MIETTLSQLRQLKLNGMASALQTQLEQPGTYEGLTFAERLQLLVDHEDQARHQRKQDRLTRAAQFKLKAYAKDIDYLPARGLQQSQMASLLLCDLMVSSMVFLKWLLEKIPAKSVSVSLCCRNCKLFINAALR